MGEKLGRRLAVMAGAFACAAVLTAGTAWAAPAFTDGSWETDDGGAVTVDKTGVFNIAFTDQTTHTNIFSTGKLVSKNTTADGKIELVLKPSTPVAGGGIDSWVVDVGPDGNAELFAVSKGDRRKECGLTK